MKENTAAVYSQVPVEVATYLLNEKRNEIAKLEARLKVDIVLIPNKFIETPHYKLERLKHDDERLATYRISYSLAEEPEQENAYLESKFEGDKPKAEAMVKGIQPDAAGPGPGAQAGTCPGRCAVRLHRTTQRRRPDGARDRLLRKDSELVPKRRCERVHAERRHAERQFDVGFAPQCRWHGHRRPRSSRRQRSDGRLRTSPAGMAVMAAVMAAGKVEVEGVEGVAVNVAIVAIEPTARRMLKARRETTALLVRTEPTDRIVRHAENVSIALNEQIDQNAATGRSVKPVRSVPHGRSAATGVSAGRVASAAEVAETGHRVATGSKATAHLRALSIHHAMRQVPSFRPPSSQPRPPWPAPPDSARCGPAIRPTPLHRLPPQPKSSPVSAKWRQTALMRRTTPRLATESRVVAEPSPSWTS